MSVPGHKVSHDLIEREAYRRIMSGEMPERLDQFAEHLLGWFREKYPGAPPMTRDTVENQIRETWDRRHDLIRGG
jgi:hypothetical protein